MPSFYLSQRKLIFELQLGMGKVRSGSKLHEAKMENSLANNLLFPDVRNYRQN